MKRLHSLTISTLLAFALTSCNGDELLHLDPNGVQSNIRQNTFSGQFKAIWNGINEGYTYWPFTDVDWDRRYWEFLPVFEQLDKDYKEWQEADTASNEDFISPDSLKNIYKSLTDGLIDGHMEIRLQMLNNMSRSIAFPPSRMLWTRENGNPDAIESGDFRQYTFLRMIANTASDICECFEIDNGGSMIADSYNACYVVNRKYLYYRYPEFDYDDFEANENKPEQNQSGYHKCLKYFRNLLADGQDRGWLKGVIIDIRRNGGGYCNAFPYSPIGMLLDGSMRTIGTYQGRNGIGHYDLTPEIPFIVTGSAETDYSGPVVLLTDRRTASMSEIAVMTAQAMPNWHTIGGTTYGAIGGWFGNDYFTYMNGEVGNGYSWNSSVSNYANYCIVMSHMILCGPDKVCHEGVGISPDYSVPFDMELNGGSHGRRQDSQFEAAIRFLDRNN